MLYNKTIFVIYVVAFLDLFSVSMISVTFPHYLKNELGMSATIAGFVGSIYGVVQFFSSPLVGRWYDMVGYRRVMVTCLLLCAPAYFSLISYQWTIVILSRIISGCFKHTQNLSRTYLASFATGSEKVRAYGRLNAMGNVGFIAGPALSAWLLKNYGYGSIYMSIGLTFVLNAVLVYFFTPNSSSKNNKEEENSNNNNNFESTFSTMFKGVDWKIHWDLFATRFLLSFVVLLYRSSYNWMMSDKFHVDAVVQNYLASYQGVISFLSSYYCNRICSMYNNNTLRIYKHAIILMLISLFGLVFSPNFVIFALFLTPFCISTSVTRVICLDLTTERCTAFDLGLILGVAGSVTSTARAISPAMGGVLHDLDPDFPSFLCIFTVIISYVITVKYTYSNQLKFNVATKR